ncbi:formate/nitrite transporter family protein [Blastococcus goldschmidtiae]|uniref:Formate/nitrite transporter family protein n=1 Tax=Blastococcus goldschmidtiae TaxID=3075546 RepID=A0ABU2K7G7_9ACTN|nr:formate/nitrite transporter family protein [Blastococcus sp. DSM 46792]MDT0276141.1 formate/nitrite transporter family protein [Blastococcus sp. DSM 46792]
MAVAPSPKDIYERSKEEGHRRLSMSLLDMVSTAFIAGVTIVFGIVALGVIEGDLGPAVSPGVASVAGALAFAVGVVFLIVGRSELFTEDFFDPVAAAVSENGRKPWLRLGRLWVVTLALNLVGGGILVALMTVPGALPPGAADALVSVAEDIAAKEWAATFVRALFAGALITLLSYMVQGCNSVAARILVAYLVGFLLALGPFDHVVVSALHLLFGIWLSDAVAYVDLWRNLGLATAGNMIGGLLLITFTHTTQVKG